MIFEITSSSPKKRDIICPNTICFAPNTIQFFKNEWYCCCIYVIDIENDLPCIFFTFIDNVAIQTIEHFSLQKVPVIYIVNMVISC